MHLRKDFGQGFTGLRMVWFPVYHPRLNPLLPSIRQLSLFAFSTVAKHHCPLTLSSRRTPNHAELSAWVLLVERPISLVVDEAVLPGSVESLSYYDLMPSN
jgi:hypothetical protein